LSVHEASLCRRLLAQVLDIARERDAAAVTAISLRLGPLSRIDPGHLIEDFLRIARGTPAQDARLEISAERLRVQCQRCGAESDTAVEDPCCGRCGNGEVRVLNGAELLLTGVELAT
jgi:hydrogenase nickel incorporation protein HypA/HybF